MSQTFDFLVDRLNINKQRFNFSINLLLLLMLLLLPLQLLRHHHLNYNLLLLQSQFQHQYQTRIQHISQLCQPHYQTRCFLLLEMFLLLLPWLNLSQLQTSIKLRHQITQNKRRTRVISKALRFLNTRFSFRKSSNISNNK